MWDLGLSIGDGSLVWSRSQWFWDITNLWRQGWKAIGRVIRNATRIVGATKRIIKQYGYQEERYAVQDQKVDQTQKLFIELLSNDGQADAIGSRRFPFGYKIVGNEDGWLGGCVFTCF